MSLNPQQQAAVRHCDGPLLVLAGAGSGKTRVITEKIAYLVKRRGMAPGRIAAITFTNKAAREMRERVAKLLPSAAAQELLVSTFHAFGLRFMQIEHAHVGRRRGFSVLDVDDCQGILKDLLPRGLKPDEIAMRRQAISTLKNRGIAPALAAASAASAGEVELAALYGAYQERLQIFNAVDFDDLIRLPLAALEDDETLRRTWQERVRYLLVDEYQDTNDAQYRLVKALVGERAAFTVVGDDDQSIYAWRGANPENLRQLASDFPQLGVIKLEQNYRCAQRILRAANAVIGHNAHLFDKRLWSQQEEGAPIRVVECRDDDHEADHVAGAISYLAQRHETRWNQFAILYRGNYQSRALEKALRLMQIPYHLTGGTAFLERGEVKDVLAYLRLLANPDDDAAFLRIVNTPRRDIGATTLEKLAKLAASRRLSLLRTAHSDSVLAQLAPRPASALHGFVSLIDALGAAARQLPVADVVEQVIQRTSYEQYLATQFKDATARARRMENLTELVQWFRAMEKGGSGNDLVAQLALLSHGDRDDGGNTVRLMTLHSAKGLEFDFVFIVGFEDGLLPHQNSVDDGQLEEERRLLYVGITRARRQLALSYARRRRRFGEIVRNQPSRFLDELPARDLHLSGRDQEQDQAHSNDVAATHIAQLKALLAE